MTDVEVRPLHGLWRTPNELTAPMGSCRTLDNCVIRKAGVIEPMPDLISQGASLATVHRMFDAPGDDVLVIESSGGTYALKWVDKAAGTTATVTVNGSAPSFEEGSASLVRFRDRYYLTSKQGLLCMDSAGDTTARRAGFVAPPFFVSATNSNTDAQAIAWGSERAYRAVFERELADGSIIIGPPSSAAAHVAAGGATSDVTLRIAWETPTAEIAANDFVSLYATDAVANGIPFVGGDTYRLVKRVQLTSTDITNEYVDIKDDVPDANLGVELYTNPGQRGATKANYPPPYLRDVVLFKGCLVGIAYNEAYSLTLRVPGTFGSSVDDTVPERVKGVGQRAITGNTNSNTTISNVTNADHFKGLSVGQYVSHADFPVGTQIVSWDSGAQTITTDTAATATNAGQSITIYDVIEIAGVEYQIGGLRAFFADPSGEDDGVSAIVSSPYRTKLYGESFALRAERAAHAGTTFGVRGTNGSNYSPNIPALSETAKTADDATQGNRIAWSAPNEPEHWPLVNRDVVGEGDFIRLIVAGDICYIFTNKAEVYAMTGEPDAWAYTLIAENVQLVTAGSAVAFDGVVYAWTDRGVVTFLGGAMGPALTNPRLTDDMKSAYHDLVVNDAVAVPWTWRGELAVDRFNRELWLITGKEGSADGVGQPWLYNLLTDEWFRLSNTTLRAPVYVESLSTMFVANRSEADAYSIREFEEFDSAARKASVDIVFNRTDLGMGGGVKKWREAVLHFRASASGDESFSITTSTDATTGGASTSTTYAVTMDSDDPAIVPCHVSRNTGMGVQLRLRIQRTTHAYAWQLEALTFRAELLAERTGARAA